MRWLVPVLFLVLSACGRGVPGDAPVVVAGDSVMAWNRVQGGSVADGLERLLEVQAGDVSLPLARVMDGRGALNIPNQLEGVDAPWVVLNGGANDLGVGCTGGNSRAILDRLIAQDGRSGAIPQMVAEQRARGSRVVWVDYYTSPRYAGTSCVPIYDEMEDRLRRMAEADPGVTLVDMGDVLPSSDLSLFASDRIHPSAAGSARIAQLVAAHLRDVDPERFAPAR
ncbi:SGNH/GDSL hydrolase family protein [Pseudoponticoccus marisrubri]|uniref:GDSL family lipase n=1 Tax=Pseudoponticoccus marisrubri TaxID=1685382 RepID=A0A0W7WIE2_9RHOB|nr:SGNH/GDSL hydrolase family protein [Pseudoponticoccus marisrubri]KUF10279.1 GDSL family lipase [Pseudoponticoccus marisrubri]